MGAIGKGLEKVGAQSRLNHLKVAANNIVFADIVDGVQSFKHVVNQPSGTITATITGIAGVKIAFKQGHQIAGNIQIAG